MKGIVIDETNRRFIFSKIEKFFKNRKRFYMWHQFNGGMKKRLKHTINLRRNCAVNYKVNIDRHYTNVHLVRETDIDPEYIRISLDYDSGLVIEDGCEVWFLGNRIIIKERLGYQFNGYQYLYNCLQIE